MAGAAFGSESGRAVSDPLLVVDVGGFEGPLDLLLDLARRQKVDLHDISVLALAEQYLDFVETARAMRLELAADYLVMAAWLAYLKSRLLLPEPPKPDGPSASELATALANRLRRLEAIRKAAQLLTDRPQLGREFFARGAAEPAAQQGERDFTGSLYDLLSTYARQRQRTVSNHVTVVKRPCWSLVDARAALERLVGQAGDWMRLDGFLLRYIAQPEMRPTVLASALSAALEFVREGRAVLRQDAPFGPLMLRRNEVPA
jgi:segregation and condensation protein A